MKLSGKALPVFFTATSFLGASLIFMVQPLVSKLMLPHFGGAATLWATASLFFQMVLLGSYLITHVTSRYSIKKQMVILGSIAVVSLPFLPIAFSESAGTDLPVILRVIVTLTLMIGIPFTILATTGPLVQRWYSLSSGPRSEDPYFIYAASNIGSFVGLFSYPFLIEPYLTLSQQRNLWSALFILFLLMLSFCGFTVLSTTKYSPVAKLFDQETSVARKLKWVALAFIPSSLMLGITTQIATDVGSFPLLWVIPLGIYLLTMIIAFAQKSRQVPMFLPIAASVVSLAALYLFVSKLIIFTLIGIVVTSMVAALALFLVGLSCHLILAADRPEAKNLTAFFVFVSLGGALGGFFNGFIAPMVFDTPLETTFVLLIVPVIALAKNIKTVAAGTVLAVIATAFIASDTEALYKARTFYGSYKVMETVDKTGKPRYELFSGTTLHGAQNKEEPTTPTTYYNRKGGMGSLFKTVPHKEVAVVGLGTGTIATYAESGDRFTFFEIDEEVKEIAENNDYFTYLNDSRGEVTVRIEDGRLGLASLPDGSLDIIVLDAFSSDSVPTHLLTTEAFDEYWAKLKPDGVIAVHLSNRFFDLQPLIKGEGEELAVLPLTKIEALDEDDNSSSEWTALAKGEATTTKLQADGWEEIRGEAKVFTDDYSPILELLHK